MAALTILMLSLLNSVSATIYKNADECSCGFYDKQFDNLFTDTAIVYFNETTEFPEAVFAKSSYMNQCEKGWNTLFREGANSSNVLLATENTTSLELLVDPSTPDHLVVGGQAETVRKDILYGSFRFYLKPSLIPGTSLTAQLAWNDTQAWSMNAQSTDDLTAAWVSMLSADEFPDRDLGINYTVLQNDTFHLDPFDFNEYRIDWTDKELNFTIAQQVLRRIKKHGDRYAYPQTPAPVVVKHWSIGNYFSTQGPPAETAKGNIGYVRLFFNSSLANEESRQQFDSRCRRSDACDVDDNTIRGFTAYSTSALEKWHQIQPKRSNKTGPSVILIFCGSVSFALIMNAILQRTIFKWRFKSLGRQTLLPSGHPSGRPTNNVSRPEDSTTSLDSEADLSHSPQPSQNSYADSISESGRVLSAVSKELEKRHSRPSWWEYVGQDNQKTTQSYLIQVKQDTAAPATVFGTEKDGNKEAVAHPTNAVVVTVAQVAPTPVSGDMTPTNKEQSMQMNSPATRNLSHLPITANLATTKKRVDYLAGLVAFACLLVTAIHFCLTFIPSVVNPSAFVHYAGETWVRKTVSSYFLNLIWIGPFLMTQTNFLVMGYLKNGDLMSIAEKSVARPFRMLIPVAAVAMLEYFLCDSGATYQLQYLPSVTWSTWPFMTVPKNFGYFLSEILELAYLIPNAAPQITFNYCTGVLWTIPVQLQGTWITLLAVIIIKEIKKPWKRLGYYAVCIIFSWYALSWGTYFYIGILFTDLEITFKYRKWLDTRPLIYYPVLFLLVCMCFGALSLDAITQSTEVNYATYEYALHPDTASGMALWDINNGTGPGYPQYYIPKLHGIVFSIGIQGMLTLSPVVQRFFSCRPLMLIFPHIFTIYLVHGFVFWSIGAILCIWLAGQGIPYWANIVVVAVVCYTTIFLSVPILTPVVETLGRSIANNVWRDAHDPPNPRHHTLYPFPSNFLFIRNQEQTPAPSPGSSSRSLPLGLFDGRHGLEAFKRFYQSVLAVFSQRFTIKTIPAQPADAVPSRASVDAPVSARARAVGWRGGRMNTNVAILRNNNI